MTPLWPNQRLRFESVTPQWPAKRVLYDAILPGDVCIVLVRECTLVRRTGRLEYTPVH